MLFGRGGPPKSQPYWINRPAPRPELAAEDIRQPDSQALHKVRHPYVYGHTVQLHTQVRLAGPVEQIRQPDHYSRLFFGRATPGGAVSTQPFWINPAVGRPDLAAEDIRQPHHEVLHQLRFAPTYGHTVQQHTQVRLTGRVEEIRQPDHQSRLFFGRSSTTPVSTQPFWINPPARFPGLTLEEIRHPDHSGLHRYRTGYQTVGQPWATWPPYRGPSFDPEVITGRTHDIYPFRQITVTQPPGQPWYQWPPIKVTIEPEEKMWRTDHDLALYPFRPHDAFVPPVEVFQAENVVRFRRHDPRPEYARQNRLYNEYLDRLEAERKRRDRRAPTQSTEHLPAPPVAVHASLVDRQKDLDSVLQEGLGSAGDRARIEDAAKLAAILKDDDDLLTMLD